MALTKTVTVEITIDRVQINFASGAVTVEGPLTARADPGKVTVTLRLATIKRPGRRKCSKQLTRRMDESGRFGRRLAEEIRMYRAPPELQ